MLRDEEKPCFELDFITADLIEKYALQSDYSIFLCGPAGMYSFLDKQIETRHVRTVASLLGHAQASTTLDIYAHAFDKNKRKAQEKLEKAIGL